MVLILVNQINKSMNFLKYLILTFILFVSNFESLQAQVHKTSWRRIINQKEGDWFASDEAKAIAENVLFYQRNIGGWPKNIQMQEALNSEEKKALLKLKSSTKDVTTDNGATTQEMVYLSKMYRQVPDETYKKAFLLGVDYLLEAQYDNGGWPQFYPLKEGYYTHITYNDDSMINILNLLRELRDKTNTYSIQPSKETIEKISKAIDKGIDCILKTQYKQNGVLTVWCAQHDENTLQPAKA
jgi:pectinesterase